MSTTHPTVAACVRDDIRELPESERNEIVRGLITAADVVAWLNAKVAASGLVGVELIVGSNHSGRRVFIATNRIGFGVGNFTESGETPEEAFEKSKKYFKTPEGIAQSKREMAAKLLAEAEALAPQDKLKAVVAEEREVSAV